MDKKILLIPFFLLILISCSELEPYRTVTVIIPEHPWETYSDAKLWYSIKWNDAGEIKELFADSTTREIRLKIKCSETVIICAYPLGDMQPFGCGITPDMKENTFVLNQDYGFVSDLLLNLNSPAIGFVNYPLITEKLQFSVSDFRLIDSDRFVYDVLNGKLSSSTLKVVEPVKTGEIVMLSGIWISESVHDSRLIVSSSETVNLNLPCGVHRYYNSQRDIEMRIVVSTESVYKHERQALVPK